MSQIVKYQSVKDALKYPDIQGRISELMGKNAAAFCSSIIQISGNPMIAKCEPMSVIKAAMTAGTLGLSINPNLGFAHIVPYGNQATFQIGWKGLVQLAQRTGRYRMINVLPIYPAEFISWNPLTEDLSVDFTAPKDGEPVGYAFVFELTDGFRKTIYWTRQQCLEHGKRYSQSFKRDLNQGKKTSLWSTDFDKMAMKTLVKLGLSQFGPLSVEMERAIVADQAVVKNVESNHVEYIDNPENYDTETSQYIEHGPVNRWNLTPEDMPNINPKLAEIPIDYLNRALNELDYTGSLTDVLEPAIKAITNAANRLIDMEESNG